MDEKTYTLLVWHCATDSIKNAAHGNQNIGVLNEVLMETRKRLKALGVSDKEIAKYE